MSYQDLPAPMHPRYNEYLDFLKGCPHRQTPSTLEFGFWVFLELSWLKNNFSMDSLERIIAKSNERLEEIEQLKTDLDRLHRERENFHIQCSAQAEEIERLNDEVDSLKNHLFAASQENLRLKTWRASFDDSAIGERGHACMSVDGGNL